jgi:hypothetical protein
LLNCLRLATYGSSREQDRPTLSKTDYEPRIVSVAHPPIALVVYPGRGVSSPSSLPRRTASVRDRPSSFLNML